MGANNVVTKQGTNVLGCKHLFNNRVEMSKKVQSSKDANIYGCKCLWVQMLLGQSI